MRLNSLVVSAVFLLPGSLLAQENPVTPYVDPSQIDCPDPKHSFYREPWRAFLETRPAETFLQGIGINYNLPPAADDWAVRVLAQSGIKSFRIEVGWGSVAWDETHLDNEKRLRRLLDLCKKYGVRPNLLLNANHGVPCPVRFFEKRLAEDAMAGSRSVKFVDITGLVIGRSGINHLTDSAAAEALITAIDPATGTCRLSKPLPKAISHDIPVRMATLKYAPLFPVGTKEFEETAAGWVHYATLVTDVAAAAGIDQFDVEIWNELSFGSNFTDAGHYYDPAPFPQSKNFLLPGGSCWEMARRTVDSVKRAHPEARLIWGFSNTTFFHCPVAKLPPGMDGQSYHPYGTGTKSYPKEEDLPQFNLEGFTPTMQTRLPEGWAHLFVKTESLMKLLNPEARKAHPPGIEHFHHCMTEHGVVPGECGISDPAAAWDLKTKCALRSYCLWINKGIDLLDYFCAYDSQPLGMGLLNSDIRRISSDARWDDVATPPLKSLRNMVRAFDGAKPLDETAKVSATVTELGEPRQIFEGDSTHPALFQRQAFAVLPFQVDAHRFVIAVYAMTYDVTKRFEPERYRVTLSGLPGKVDSVSLYDPLTDTKPVVTSKPAGMDGVTVEFAATDYPQLLIVTSH